MDVDAEVDVEDGGVDFVEEIGVCVACCCTMEGWETDRADNVGVDADVGREVVAAAVAVAVADEDEDEDEAE